MERELADSVVAWSQAQRHLRYLFQAARREVLTVWVLKSVPRKCVMQSKQVNDDP